MDDPYYNRKKTEPRCSFCGCASSHASGMVSGPDVYICATCVQEASHLIETRGEAEADDVYEVEHVDYEIAFWAMHEMYQPVYDLLMRIDDKPAEVIRAVAEEVAYYRRTEKKRTKGKVHMARAVHRAVEFLAGIALDDHHLDN